MLPNDMNLWIGKIKSYNNKILVSSSSFNIGTNLKINLEEAEKWKKFRNLEAKKSALLWLKSHNFSETFKLISTKESSVETSGVVLKIKLKSKMVDLLPW